MAFLCPVLRTAKDVVKEVSKKSQFRKPFGKRHGTRSQRLMKSEDQHLYHISWLLLTQLSRKKSLLVICKILGLFVNTFTADGKYSLLRRDNLASSTYMQFSQKQKIFSEFFSAFLKCRLTFDHFQKKDGAHSLCISYITDCERRC